MVVQDDSLDSDGYVFGEASDKQITPRDLEKTESRRSDPRVFKDGKSLSEYKEIKIYMLTEPG